MRLYGHPRSLDTRKVLLALAEKGHDIELVQLDLPAGEHLRPSHRARSPFGKIPALEDGSFSLYEAAAIMRYLDETLSGPRLTPAGARERARCEQWLCVEAAYVAPAVERLMAQLVARPQFGLRPDHAEVAQARRDLSEALDVLDRALGTDVPGAFVAGALFSLADIALMPSCQLLLETGQDDLIGNRPHIAAWWKRVRARPTSQKVLGHAEVVRIKRHLHAVSSALAEAL